MRKKRRISRAWIWRELELEVGEEEEKLELGEDVGDEDEKEDGG